MNDFSFSDCRPTESLDLTSDYWCQIFGDNDQLSRDNQDSGDVLRLLLPD